MVESSTNRNLNRELPDSALPWDIKESMCSFTNTSLQKVLCSELFEFLLLLVISFVWILCCLLASSWYRSVWIVMTILTWDLVSQKQMYVPCVKHYRGKVKRVRKTLRRKTRYFQISTVFDGKSFKNCWKMQGVEEIPLQVFNLQKTQ